MSDTPERIWLLWREIGLIKGRVTCTEQDHTDEGFPEYVRADLHEAERARAEKAEAERDAAIASLSEAARMRGEAEGKLLAAETPGVLEGWMREAEQAKAERDALAGKLAKVTAAYRVEAMRREAYSQEAFDRHIAEITGGGNE